MFVVVLIFIWFDRQHVYQLDMITLSVAYKNTALRNTESSQYF